MKSILYDVSGKKKGEIELPVEFSKKIREDIVLKCFEAEKLVQPYASASDAGKNNSASGTISQKRHDWKGHYGKGISRVPRKTMSRRGTQFFWIGAEVSGTRGGRRAHPPKGIGKEKKINKKEIMIGRSSALASTGNEKYVLGRYERLDKFDVKVPIVVESKLEKLKTKELLALFKNILGDSWMVALKKKVVRKGRGKTRGRKYKSNAGALLVVGSDENVRFNGFEVRRVDEIKFKDLYPLGRITIYTEKAMEEMKK